jgi:hypothetical protein
MITRPITTPAIIITSTRTITITPMAGR